MQAQWWFQRYDIEFNIMLIQTDKLRCLFEARQFLVKAPGQKLHNMSD